MNISYPILLEKLAKGDPFAFTRWGDGEIGALLGNNTPNCDDHSRDYVLQKALNTILSEQDKTQTMYIGYQDSPQNTPYRKMVMDKFSNIEWSNADILHHASINNILSPFFDVIAELTEEGVKTMLISGNHWLYKVIEIDTFIPLMATDSFYKHTIVDIEDHVKKHDPDVVLFACSMASNVWISELWKKYPFKTFIDIGSVLDPYAGVVSRKYHWEIVERLGIAKEELKITGSQKR